MPNRRLIAPVVVTAAVAGGGLAGAVLGVPGLADAQETTTPDAQPEPDGEGFRIERRGPGVGLDAAADALGMEVDELHEALHNGQTIAEVAADKGVDVNTVIDAMVNAIVEETGRDADEVREHVTTIVNEGRPEGPGFGPGGPRFHRHFAGPGLDAAAEALGVETEDLVAALRDGKTIADVAEEQGVDVDTVIDAMVDEARERITEFVNEGPQRPDVEEGTEESSADVDPTAA